MTAAQIVWFVVYLVLAMLIYGSLFIAIGAAATDLKDAQALMTPVHAALHVADVHLDAGPARAGQHAGHRRVAGAVRDAGADDAAAWR